MRPAGPRSGLHPPLPWPPGHVLPVAARSWPPRGRSLLSGMVVNCKGRSAALAVAALSLVQFIDVLGVTVVVTALPSMLASLHTSQSDSPLVATGYSMFFGGLLMLGARLGDRFGHRRTILVRLDVLAAGGVVAAPSSSVAALTAGCRAWPRRRRCRPRSGC